MEVSGDIKERRRKNNLILSSSSEILQILEIPQFMNSCIRNDLYEEALLLPSFVKRLVSKHGDIPLICVSSKVRVILIIFLSGVLILYQLLLSFFQSIAKDVEKSWWELMRHLLRHLTTDISLPKCLQIIGYLRRMNIFSEAELRLKFLQARGSWLDSLLVTIPTEDSTFCLLARVKCVCLSIKLIEDR